MGNNRSSSTARLRAAILSVAVCFLGGPSLSANQMEELAQRVGVRILAEGSSDSEILTVTKSRIPYGKMSARSQQRASQILGNVSQFRRMPSLQYPVDPSIYQYLINNPDVAVSTWRVMGISKLQMFQTSEFEYEASAEDGSEGIADVLWRDANQCIFIVQGKYTSPLLPTAIHASALVWLQYRFVQAKDNTYLVNQQVETFVYFPSSAVDTIAKLTSRLTNTILDRNAFEVSLYARMMSQAAQKDPEWIEQLAQRMDGVLPQRRMELVQVSRGQTPSAGQMLPAVTKDTTQHASLPMSGEFKAFEYSMHQLNKHVPLIPDEAEHTPSYGKSIGANHEWMATPHAYMTEEAKQAIAEQEAKRQRAIQYDQFYSNPEAKGVPEFLTPAEVPPSMHGTTRSNVADLMESPTPITFSARVSDPRAHGKASVDTLPAGMSRPLSNSTGTQKSSSTIAAQPVSRTNSRPVDSGSQKPVNTTPPIQTAPQGSGSPKPVDPVAIPPADVK